MNNTVAYRHFPLRLPTALALAAAVMLSACGGGGGAADTAAGSGTTTVTAPPTTTAPTPSDPATTTPPGTTAPTAVTLVPTASVSGVAAIGRPLSQATISLKCVGGVSAQGTAAADGSFTVNLPERVFPCLARARGTGTQGAEVYHSVALEPGIMNITPVTDAVLALTTNQSTTAFFDSATDAGISGITATKLQADLTRLQATLPSPIVLPAGRNPFTGTFKADGVDAMDKVLDLIRAVLDAENMSWQDALDYVRAEALITSDEPVFAGLAPLFGPPGTVVTVSGVNFPVTPVPAIKLVSATGQSTTATVSPGNTSKSLSFTVPTTLAAGDYAIVAGGYTLPLRFFVAVSYPATFHPFYKTGPARNFIQNSGFAGQARLQTGVEGFILEYPGRIRTGETCRMRVNIDESVSELDKDGKEIRRYEWEDRTHDFTGDAPILYASNAWGGPDTNHGVKVAHPGSGMYYVSFIYGSGRITDNFRMCISNAVDLLSGQFSRGPSEPALSNWSKLEGKHKGTYVWGWGFLPTTTIDGRVVYGSLPDWLRLPFTVKSLNLTIEPGATCGIEVSFGGAVTFLINDNAVGRFGVSDRFRYVPAVRPSDFNTSEIFMPMEFPPENNLRLLSDTPNFFSTEPKMVLEYGLPASPSKLYGYNSVTIYHGVKNYGRTPGRFQYDGAISCFFERPLPNWNHTPTTNVN